MAEVTQAQSELATLEARFWNRLDRSNNKDLIGYLEFDAGLYSHRNVVSTPAIDALLLQSRNDPHFWDDDVKSEGTHMGEEVEEEEEKAVPDLPPHFLMAAQLSGYGGERSGVSTYEGGAMMPAFVSSTSSSSSSSDSSSSSSYTDRSAASSDHGGDFYYESKVAPSLRNNLDTLEQTLNNNISNNKRRRPCVSVYSPNRADFPVFEASDSSVTDNEDVQSNAYYYYYMDKEQEETNTHTTTKGSNKRGRTNADVKVEMEMEKGAACGWQQQEGQETDDDHEEEESTLLLNVVSNLKKSGSHQDMVDFCMEVSQKQTEAEEAATATATAADRRPACLYV